MAGMCRHDSGLASDDSAGFVEQEETSGLDSIEWTNEKHSLYLKSMEASFINQLYNSKDLFSSASGQFGVHKPGRCQKSVHGSSPQNEEADERSTSVANRRQIKNFRGGANSNSASYNEECSGQNFANEDYKNRPPASGQRAKRSRNPVSAAISNDHAVPFGISQDRSRFAR